MEWECVNIVVVTSSIAVNLDAVCSRQAVATIEPALSIDSGVHEHLQ